MLDPDNSNQYAGLYRVVSAFYAAEGNPCTPKLAFCGVVYHDDPNSDHHAPCFPA